MTINFICRASKARKNGLSPIEMSVIIDGDRTIIALDRKIDVKKWNASTQKVKGEKEINDYLDAVRKKCWRIETELIKSDSLCIREFVDAFKNGSKSTKDTLLQIYDKHNMLYKNDVLCGRVENGALKKYINSRKRLSDYLKSIGMVDIPVKNITPSFCNGYQSYCLMTLQQSTVNKELKMFKRILQFAVNERYIDINPFNIKIKDVKTDHHPLTSSDVEKIWRTDINNERLSQIRDLFIFQCYTGLAYIDMATLRKDDIIGNTIYKKRQKTDVKSVIPLLPVSKAILEKYGYNLPVISNQKYNVLLKALGELCGIKVKLHSHLARHTAATVMINNGIELPIIAKILGHSSTKITEKVYASVREKTIIDSADRIAEAFKVVV